MLKSLELLKNGYRGLTSALYAEQSSSQESKPAQSELKSDIIQRVKEVTNEIPQQPIILSVVTQALASTTEDDLLKMMVTVRDELTKIIEKHQWVEFAPDIPKDDMYGEISNTPDYDERYGENIVG